MSDGRRHRSALFVTPSYSVFEDGIAAPKPTVLLKSRRDDPLTHHSYVQGTRQDARVLKSRRKRGEPASAAGGKPVLILAPSGVVASWMKHLRIWGHFACDSLVAGPSSVEVTTVRMAFSGMCPAER